MYKGRGIKTNSGYKISINELNELSGSEINLFNSYQKKYSKLMNEFEKWDSERDKYSNFDEWEEKFDKIERKAVWILRGRYKDVLNRTKNINLKF